MACIRKRRGHWVTDYRDGGGVRRWRTFGTKRDAEDFLAKTIPEVRQRKRALVPVTITVLTMMLGGTGGKNLKLMRMQLNDGHIESVDVSASESG